jgi:hypothetical protein
MSSKSSLPQSRALVQYVLTGNISIRDLCGGSGIVASDAAARYRKGHALREHRVRTLGLRQRQLAELLETSPVFLNAVEQGRADMTDQQ